jgi:hypothetical protein
MDGFQPSSGLVVLGSTNRSDVLDKVRMPSSYIADTIRLCCVPVALIE